ncbi:HTTM domain-containing protein [Viridibacillus sp. YIM B01967]|uniref:HTTM domain-containing protein n=1 Tax=Viridibacillus soli TaxID=2798301 RepID=A0ABS1H992_9BACL|nr:sporulation-delaying protein SdpB family protein [Viridibacillus soli]MBK3495588.1 HTTM domain-containing protein [Viridibacillus soli]
MFKKISIYAYNLGVSNSPWTNVYGFARTLLALSLLLTLSLNDAKILFRPASGITEFPSCTNNISIFCIVPNDYLYLNIVKWVCVCLLILVASGWRPQITGIIHWYIAYSLQVSAMTIDGGEQVNAVLSLLLLPITLTDSRKWHWQAPIQKEIKSDKEIVKRIIAIVTFFVIRFQIAILYLHSTVAKVFNTEWIDGTAVYYYLADPMLGLPPLLYNLVQPILSSPFVVFATWGTLVLQICLFGALFVPEKHWNKFLIIALVFHESIAVMLGLISFSITMCGALILYLRPLDQEFKLLKKQNLTHSKNEPLNFNTMDKKSAVNESADIDRSVYTCRKI